MISVLTKVTSERVIKSKKTNFILKLGILIPIGKVSPGDI